MPSPKFGCGLCYLGVEHLCPGRQHWPPQCWALSSTCWPAPGWWEGSAASPQTPAARGAESTISQVRQLLQGPIISTSMSSFMVVFNCVSENMPTTPTIKWLCHNFTPFHSLTPSSKNKNKKTFYKSQQHLLHPDPIFHTIIYIFVLKPFNFLSPSLWLDIQFF